MPDDEVAGARAPGPSESVSASSVKPAASQPPGELGHRVAGGGRGVDEGAQVVAEDELDRWERRHRRHRRRRRAGRDRPAVPSAHRLGLGRRPRRAGGMLAGVSEPTVQPIVAESAGFAGPDELAAALEEHRLPARRGPGDRRLPGAGHAPAAVPRGRGRASARPRWRTRWPRSPAGRSTGCSATRASRPARRSTTGTSAASCCTCAPPRRRTPTTTPRRSRPPSTTGASCWPGRCCRRSRTPPACCWSTRSTGPTTSSRRSCWRCSRTSRSRSPSSARSARSPRRW